MTLDTQQCPQCTGIITVTLTVDALLCPHCGAINVLTHGVLDTPTTAELDLILLRPEVRRAIEQASAIRQALFGGRYTLADPTCLLDPEPHPSLAAAVARGAQAPWTATVWIIIDPSGHVAAHRARSIGGHS